jgi:gliding motility-associated-like protein
VYCQLVTSPGAPPASLVQNVLLGPGVSVSNVTYNGSPSAISKFSATGTNLGITSGIVITTGTVYNNSSGPQGPNNQTNSGVDNNMGGSGLLSSIINGTQTYNAAILEFDFIPYADTVRFKYVFGSEEYPEFAPPNNSTYNDVFGFFISGPGISGLQNIAKLPNGSVVSINNVNQITNSSYFNNNGDGTSAPQNGSDIYIQYDGFTDVLEAVSKVQCGSTYHLILAIADVGDGIFDSGIFLEANSLSSKTPVDISCTISEHAFPDTSLMAEGCVSATVTLRRMNNINSSLTIPIHVTGTAIEGIDYSNIPDVVTFAPGQSTIQFSFNALADVLTEGQESIQLEFELMDPCGNLTPIVLNLGIADVLPVTVNVESSDVLCPGENLEVIASASGGGGPYTYSWNTGETTASIFVSPLSTQTYTVSVTDNCLHQTAVASSTIEVPIYLPIVIEESDDITVICPYMDTMLTAIASGGAGNYTYQWYSNHNEQLGAQTNQEVVPSTSTVYYIQVTDQCGTQVVDSVVYVITSPPLILSMSDDKIICPGDTAQISVTAIGGYGAYRYDWQGIGDTTSSVIVSPNLTMLYIVYVSDDCQTFKVSDSVIVKVIKPSANFNISSHTLFDDLPITFQNTTLNGDFYSWNFGNGSTSTLVNPNTVYDEPGTYYVTLTATDIKGCIDSVTKPITIQPAYYVYVPNTFTPDKMRFNNTFFASTFGIQSLSVKVYNRWGEEIFSSDELNFQWDGTSNGKPVQDGTYVWVIKYISNSGVEDQLIGHVNIIR